MGEPRTLVERARNWTAGMPPTTHILADMADTIERQEREIERLRQIVEAYEEDRDPYEGGET